MSILITGETGTGKEVCARSLHYLSNNSEGPFITFDCGAVPSSLFENELFGHKKGAYTDARLDHSGIVSEAESGTLFLDEIESLCLECQVKLLRLLEGKEYRPLGLNKERRANIRIIAATNMELAEMIKNGTFRSDLYYRFDIVLSLPPLRERKNDILLLTNHFLKLFANKNKTRPKSLSKSAFSKLLVYHWPGNIRELKNVIQQANLLTPGAVIPPGNIDFQTQIQYNSFEDLSFKEAKTQVIENFEKEYISNLLIKHDGNISSAAQAAKKDRADFSKLVKKYNLNIQ